MDLHISADKPMQNTNPVEAHIGPWLTRNMLPILIRKRFEAENDESEGMISDSVSAKRYVLMKSEKQIKIFLSETYRFLIDGLSDYESFVMERIDIIDMNLLGIDGFFDIVRGIVQNQEVNALTRTQLYLQKAQKECQTITDSFTNHELSPIFNGQPIGLTTTLKLVTALALSNDRFKFEVFAVKEQDDYLAFLDVPHRRDGCG
ncbi:hypothetical protein QR680_000346 [Steinernema hermaphroditum]|uniref:Uncharacterized protein n=1 Tax=Steinernema hermaphroditum TaxID=289476 RepID=A0AA39GU91_9BILA|nr:hypothetical protein QR680_000346 [Steinernema hermaphroditum]